MKVKFTTTAITVHDSYEYCEYKDPNPDPDMKPAKSRFAYYVYFDRELTEDEAKALNRQLTLFIFAKGGQND